MSLRVEILKGEALAAAMEDLAGLRIRVFRDFPYLYDGDPAYEATYLERYARSDGAVIVGAFDGTTVIGAATAAPLEDQAGDFAEPFRQAGFRLEEVYYFGESVLLAAYRGQGIGHAFFDAREAAARSAGRSLCTFCAVVRPPDHPQRPAGYRPLDAFWKKRGYSRKEGLTAPFSWLDLGQKAATEKTMQFWLRRLEEGDA
ncbi:MAG: GNAT family N-acetyltransferase [Rhodospirillales bacterium]